MFYQTLYKKDSKDEVRSWQVERVADKYRTHSGTIAGKKTISEWTTATPKNEGKANATTSEEQANLEVEAMYEKKKKMGGYSDTVATSGTKYVEPMLAKKWEDEKLIVGHQRMFAQPKFDGVRCIATRHGLFSRKGEPFLSIPHIFESLEPVFDKHPSLILDGELYNHDLKEDFNKIISLVKKKKPKPNEIEEAKKVIQYHVYDMVDTSKAFADRGIFLANEVFSMNIDQSIKCVSTYEIETQEGLDELYGKFLQEGYEGQMIRLNYAYQNKRSKFLLKRKEFQDEEFEILAVEEGLGNRSGMAGRVTLKLPDGRTFGAGIKGGVSVNKALWNTKDILAGKKATIEFFNYTPDGIPRFPVFKSVRDDV